MPPKKVPSASVSTVSQYGDVSTPDAHLRDVQKDIGRMRKEWKKEFESLSEGLKDNLKDELIEILMDRNAPIPNNLELIIDQKVNKKLEVIENTWNDKFCAIDNKLSDMGSKISNLVDKTDSLEQHSRCDSLIIHGIQEKEDENIYTTVTDFINKTFNMSTIQVDFVNIHRMGRRKFFKNDEGVTIKTTRPVIVKFVRMIHRDKIFNEKRTLKGSGITIVENLTSDRLNIYLKLKKLDIKCWTQNGNIVALNEGKKLIFKTLSEMNKAYDNYMSIHAINE